MERPEMTGQVSREQDGTTVAEEWRKKGDAFAAAGQFNEADCSYGLSLSSARLGRYEDAEADAREAIDLDGACVEAFHTRALARKALGKRLEALADFQLAFLYDLLFVLSYWLSDLEVRKDVSALQARLLSAAGVDAVLER
ncbi:hypothetical protein KFL_015400015 [Klebsormidium nitens]|uniref:Uncharacterized protein n=1 Tax=Klebsormidium nitens TaxID=105231 RepID=A0A1Y1IVM6_KLENI|nr:hypothetical protein KFL_015400015 [Klebsormidium nitens]|eukprot:GAQ93451.1 hypothetical protein KFL_015400015 [Klebsormidium nitens]